MMTVNLNRTSGRWQRIKDFLGTTLALVAGAFTAVLVQAVISGAAAHAESCANSLIPPGMYCYPMKPEEEAAIRAEMRACGANKACFISRLARYAREANRLYKAGLREMHPNLRGALRGACGSQREVIGFTQCVRNSLGLAIDDVEAIQALRSDRKLTGEQVMADEGVRANFSYGILVSACGNHPSGRRLDTVLRALRNQVVSAYNNTNMAFNEMVSWSIWTYGCSEQVGLDVCKRDRNWTALMMEGVDNVAYRPTHPLPGRTSRTSSSSRSSSSASSGGGSSSSASSSSSTSSSSSAGEGPSETGNGTGEGSGDGTGTGDPSTGVSGVTGSTGASSSSDASSSSGVSGVSGATGTTSVSGVSGVSGATGTTSVSGVSGVSGATGTTSVSGVSGASGATGGTGPVDPRQILSQIPLGDPNGDQPLDCSEEGMARATQLMTSRLIEARLTGQAILYACRVRQSPELSASDSVRFLTQACLRVSNITRHNEAEIYLSTMVEDWFAWVDGELTRLESLPETPGQAEILDFHALVRRARAEGREGMYRVMIQRNRPSSELKTAFCPWLIALNRTTPGARRGFPREVVSCPAAMPSAPATPLSR